MAACRHYSRVTVTGRCGPWSAVPCGSLLDAASHGRFRAGRCAGYCFVACGPLVLQGLVLQVVHSGWRTIGRLARARSLRPCGRSARAARPSRVPNTAFIWLGDISGSQTKGCLSSPRHRVTGRPGRARMSGLGDISDITAKVSFPVPRGPALALRPRPSRACEPVPHARPGGDPKPRDPSAAARRPAVNGRGKRSVAPRHGARHRSGARGAGRRRAAAGRWLSRTCGAEASSDGLLP